MSRLLIFVTMLAVVSACDNSEQEIPEINNNLAVIAGDSTFAQVNAERGKC